MVMVVKITDSQVIVNGNSEINSETPQDGQHSNMLPSWTQTRCKVLVAGTLFDLSHFKGEQVFNRSLDSISLEAFIIVE